jgi:murein DD-endopeptidase MepM/ murein hydrolase activator NlpD
MSVFTHIVRIRAVVGFVVAVALAVGSAATPAAAMPVGPCLRRPVVARVVDPFRAPGCRWCPGNRGMDFATAAGTTVRAAASGNVVFAGSVAGVTWLTLSHAGDVLITYGPMDRLDVALGDAVRAGQSLGTTAGWLHFGVRIGGRYVDPAPLFEQLVHLVPRLVRLDGQIPLPARVRCPGDQVLEPPVEPSRRPPWRLS